eukprot:952131-Prymnesium_polylepis.3
MPLACSIQALLSATAHLFSHPRIVSFAVFSSAFKVRQSALRHCSLGRPPDDSAGEPSPLEHGDGVEPRLSSSAAAPSSPPAPRCP